MVFTGKRFFASRRVGRLRKQGYAALMGGQEDIRFLAVLVHRGHVAREKAEKLVPLIQQGQELDVLLAEQLGFDSAEVRRLRRTRGGQIPEIPGYEVLGNAGSGGTADVFRVMDKKTQRVIALKVLRPDATRHAPTRKSFIAEAKLLSELEHPGLVKGYGVARSGQTYFMRMEFIDGRTLLELLDEGQEFEETVALRFVLEVAEVLRYLGEQKVVHRDIKPGNIMMGADGRLKLIDLGFAAGPETPAESPEDSTVGTVQYLSPEQARGAAEADLRSDIYSLGATFFHLIVGHLPFDSSDDREILRMQVMESLSSSELKSRGLSHHVHYFIEKMMAKDKDVRYQTWDELIDDIGGQIQGRESLDFKRGDRSPSRAFKSRSSTMRKRRS